MKINKQKRFSDWYSEVVKQAKLCDLRYNLKGFVVFLPNSVSVMKRMYSIYEQVLEQKGHRPYLFPALIPKSNFELEAEHVQGFVPEVFWVERAGSDKLQEPLALRPTSETAMYRMFSQWIQGKSDLPLKTYHSAQVWRYETKSTRPFIRSREFYWIETHNAFATEDEAKNQVLEDMQISKQVISKIFGIPFIFFRRPEWDKFPGAVDTFAADTLLPDGKALQLPSTHYLGQNFAKPFNVKYTDSKGNQEYCYQTCYGPAISRIFAALISHHGDDKGLIFPSVLVKHKVVIVPIFKKDNAQILEFCKTIASNLNNSNIPCFIDDSDKSPGFKFNEYELLGIPIRLEIGEKEIDKGAVVVERLSGTKEFVDKQNLIKTIEQKLNDQDEKLRQKSHQWFESMISKAQDLISFGKLIGSKKGFIKVAFCSRTEQGKACADKLKEKFSVDARGTRFDSDEKPSADEKCIVCGKPAQVYMYFAKQY